MTERVLTVIEKDTMRRSRRRKWLCPVAKSCCVSLSGGKEAWRSLASSTRLWGSWSGQGDEDGQVRRRSASNSAKVSSVAHCHCIISEQRVWPRVGKRKNERQECQAPVHRPLPTGCFTLRLRESITSAVLGSLESSLRLLPLNIRRPVCLYALVTGADRPQCLSKAPSLSGFLLSDGRWSWIEFVQL